MAQVCVVITTRIHRVAIEANLCREGFNLAALTSSYDYVPVDANAMLHEFFTEGTIDRTRFFDRAGLLLTQAASKGKPVRIFGEIVALLAEQKCYDAVIEVEEMCNELSRLHDFNMFCAYPLRAFDRPGCESLSKRICAVHSQPPTLRAH